jgi:hypothetical protein
MGIKEYQSFETRPDGDWFVVWFEKPDHLCTLLDGEPIFQDSVSLFKTKDDALRRHNNLTVTKFGFGSALELSRYVTGKELVKIYNRCRHDVAKYREAPRTNGATFTRPKSGLTPVEWENAYLAGRLTTVLDDPLPPDMQQQPLKVALLVWEQFQFIGDKVTNKWLDGDPETGAGGSTKMYRIFVDKLRSPEGQAVIEKLPKQCRVVAQGFADLGESYLDEPELDLFALNLKRDGKLKTKQSGERIVRYYLPEMAKLGFVDYKGRRGKGGDE